MTRFSHAVTEFWKQPFAGRLTYSDQRLSLIVNPTLDEGERVTVLRTASDSHTAIALSAEVADALECDGTRTDSSPLDEARVRSALAEAGVQLHGADNLYYFPEGYEAEAETASAPGIVRQLTAGDRELFEAFEARASEQDRDDAQVDLEDWAAFGVIVEDRLVSAASTYPWRGSTLADFGVLTLTDERGHGYGRRLVRAMAGHASDLGLELQYRCQVDNAASNALAAAAGLRLFGQWEVPTPPRDDDADSSAD
ncbi:hypothetical protein ASD65_10675 [Microbacterium sp. Root61]|uniref:GNAT family N-acetyltransferase n=1 Tax=Microbacterium sp. Root61 TaxID=1736570 RepID=UPI0006FB70D0|nr:GNAT family N-acetyltransferase [Microbacterium sp. Root61]KRA24836.1 hypothetical protein ASD65_10675 [Microbacterium sp. Root61]